MDFCIFRKKENEFMPFDDGDIFVTNDEEEIREEYDKETEDGTNPSILTLDYDLYFDSTGQEHQKVTVKENDKELGIFSYMSHFDDEEDFMEAFKDWAEEYVKKNK